VNGHSTVSLAAMEGTANWFKGAVQRDLTEVKRIPIDRPSFYITPPTFYFQIERELAP
jgi:hypothetical protein